MLNYSHIFHYFINFDLILETIPFLAAAVTNFLSDGFFSSGFFYLAVADYLSALVRLGVICSS
jgi:hypothetical protein